MRDSSPPQLRAPAPGATARSPAGRATPIPRLRLRRQIVTVRPPPFRSDSSRTRRARCSSRADRIPWRPAFSSHPFCYSLLAVFSNVETYGHSTHSQDPPHPPQRHRRNLRRSDSFHPRRFSPLLAGMGLYGHLVRPYADYFGLFSEARSAVGRAPFAPRGKDHRAGIHPSLALGSCWALPGFLLVIPLIVLRLLNEEKMLCRDLPGYSDYCLRTRSRLLPLLW